MSRLFAIDGGQFHPFREVRKGEAMEPRPFLVFDGRLFVQDHEDPPTQKEFDALFIGLDEQQVKALMNYPMNDGG